MGPLARIIGSGIGLSKEFLADREARKSSHSPNPDGRKSLGSAEHDEPRQQHTSSDYDDEDDEYSDDEEDDNHGDERAIELDEAQQEHAYRSGASKSDDDDSPPNVDELLDNFARRHPPPPYSAAPQNGGRLPCPVILPQRRPHHKALGFVRAYAPVLEDCDIDQAAWLEFLDGFGKAIKGSPWFHAVNLAVAGGAMAVRAVAGPSIILRATAFVMHTSVEVSRQGYVRYGTNKYLDQMNEQFFEPRRLYCMIMSYKPDGKEAVETVDVSQNITKAVAKRGDGHGSKLGASSGKTHNEMEIPEAAPLVFPELDAMPEGEKENAIKRTGHFLSDYYDRRSQAKFNLETPDSKLNVAPQKEWASRYSDPSHAASNGNLISTLTGGTVDPKGRRQARRAGRREKLGLSKKDGRQRRKGRSQRGLKKYLREDAIYLMVVNLPSEEELQAVRAEMGNL